MLGNTLILFFSLYLLIDPHTHPRCSVPLAMPTTLRRRYDSHGRRSPHPTQSIPHQHSHSHCLRSTLHSLCLSVCMPHAIMPYAPLPCRHSPYPTPIVARRIVHSLSLAFLPFSNPLPVLGHVSTHSRLTLLPAWSSFVCAILFLLFSYLVYNNINHRLEFRWIRK